MANSILMGTNPAVFEDDHIVRRHSRSAWGAVLSGAVIAIGLQFVFTVLGIALGISIADASNSTTTAGEAARAAGDNAGAITFAAGAWWIVTGTLSLLIGGIMVGRLSTTPRSDILLWQGLTMWAITAIFGFAVVYGTAGAAASNALSVVNASDSAWFARDANRTTTTAAGTTPATDARPSAAVMEAELDRAQAAAWWSFIAMLLGITAALIGAWFGVHTNDRRRIITDNNRAAPIPA